MYLTCILKGPVLRCDDPWNPVRSNVGKHVLGNQRVVDWKACDDRRRSPEACVGELRWLRIRESVRSCCDVDVTILPGERKRQVVIPGGYERRRASSCEAGCNASEVGIARIDAFQVAQIDRAVRNRRRKKLREDTDLGDPLVCLLHATRSAFHTA
jgi:hypothetical protein